MAKLQSALVPLVSFAPLALPALSFFFLSLSSGVSCPGADKKVAKKNQCVRRTGAPLRFGVCGPLLLLFGTARAFFRTSNKSFFSSRKAGGTVASSYERSDARGCYVLVHKNARNSASAEAITAQRCWHRIFTALRRLGGDGVFVILPRLGVSSGSRRV